jgi:hypothetical protein
MGLSDPVNRRMFWMISGGLVRSDILWGVMGQTFHGCYYIEIAGDAGCNGDFRIEAYRDPLLWV